MEDVSSTLLEDGQELGSSHGFLGSLISNQGILVADQDFRLRNHPPCLLAKTPGQMSRRLLFKRV